MVAGLVIAGLRQRGQGVDSRILHRRQLAGPFLHLPVQVSVAVGQEIPRGLELQVIPHPCQQDRGADRLGDEIHPSQVKAEGFVLDSDLGSQEDHRDLPRGGLGLEAPADRVAVHLRYHDVQQDQVGWGGFHDPQRLLPAVGDLDPVLLLQEPADQVEVVRGIVHDEDGRLLGEPVVRRIVEW